MGTIKRNFYNNITPTGKFDATDLTGTVPADNIANASLNNVTSVPASVGDFVQKVSSDPTPASAGDVWYNTTSNALKSVVSLEAWSSGSNLITETADNGGQSNSQTAAIKVGGTTQNTPRIYTNVTEEYNGSGWSTGANIPTATGYLAGFGTQTAQGVTTGAIPGSTVSATYEYDGSTWTSGGSTNTARSEASASGTQTAGLVAGGYPTGTSPAAYTVAEEYNGSAWTNVTSMPYDSLQQMSVGPQTASLYMGGFSYTPSGNTLSTTLDYDGTNWTAGSSLAQAKRLGATFGVSTSAVIAGGNNGPTSYTTVSQRYNGSSWTTSAALGVGRQGFSASGSGADNTAGVIFGGRIPGVVKSGNTEEYNVSTNVITGAAWASGGNMNTSRRAISGGAGTATAGMSVGGYNTAQINSTEEYDGSTWTNSGNYPSSLYYLAHGGTQTAAWAAGGGDPVITTGNNYDGSTWTASGSLPAARKLQGRAGTQTAGVFWSGNDSGNASTNTTDEYDGSTWTSGNTMNKHHGSGHSSGGSQTAAVAVGGTNDPNSYELVDDSEFYDGTSWTTGPLSTVSVQSNGGLNQSSNSTGITIGGYLGPPGTTNAVAIYDGSVWSTGAYFPTNIQQQGGFGDLTAGVVNGGNDGAHRNETVEYNPETSAANVKTISTS